MGAAEKPVCKVASPWWRWCALISALATVTSLAALVLVLRRSAPAERFETATVKRGDVIATLEAEGNVESAHNVEIACQVDGGSTILWIVPDGTQVNEGDELVRFDSSSVEDLLSQQTIVVEQAKAAQIAAQHELAAARLALPEYVEGTFVALNEEGDAAIATAEHNLRLARHNLANTNRFVLLGYATPTQLEASVFAVEQAELQVDIAERAKTVLERYNRPKMTQDLQTRLETAAALLRSTTAEYELAQTQLARYHKQLANCTVRAPRSGLVIHANDPGSSDGPEIELGALVHQRQNVIWLPDLSQMQVRALVHESSVRRMQPGQRATVRIRDRELPAIVTEIANQPAPTKRGREHVKYFFVSALIEEPAPGLRPGETAEVTYLLDYRPDVLRAPLETVVIEDDGAFVWVENDGTVEPRRIELGAHGDLMAEIRRGLCEGEHVVLNPRDALPELESIGDGTAGHDPHRFDKLQPVSTAIRSQSTAGNAAGG